MNKFLSLLGIKTGEGPMIGNLWFLGFFLGAKLTVFTTAITALFLREFDASALPYMYIGGALLTVSFGSFFGWIGKRLSDQALFGIYLLFMIAATVALWLPLHFLGGKWIIAAGFLIMDSLWSFASIVQSGYTLKLLSLRQSKRLGGIVRTGWVAGVFLSGLSLGNLAELVGTEHLILVSAGIGLAALFLNLSLSRAAKEKFQDGNAEDDAPKSTIGNFLRNRFVWLILATYMASFGCLYFTDMMFLNEMENRFTSESEFTAFFGMFAGIGSILVFLGQTFIFNRYIARFGLLAAMVACPVVMVAFSAGVMVAGAAEMTALLFWLIAGLRMSYTVVGSVMDDPTQGVLLEALPESQQVQLSNFMGGIVAPVATALVGGILLLLTVLEASSFTMSLTLIFLCLGWFFVSVFARDEYVKVIVDTVSRRKLPKASLEMDPEMMAKMITPKLESGIPGEVIYCLWLLEETRHKSLTLRLIEQLDRGKPTVARYAAERIEALVLDEAADAVARLAKSGPPGLRGRGLITYCALTESDALEEVVSYLDSDDDELRRGAIIGVLRYGGIDGVLAAGSKFNELRFSENPESRRMAAEIIGLIGISEFYRPLAQLLKDVDMEVRRAAVKSAAALRNPKLLPALLDALKTPELRVVAIAAITAYGNTVAPDLIDTFDDCVDHFITVWIIRIAGKIGGQELITFLVGLIRSENPEIRIEALRSLVSARYQATGQDRKCIEDSIRLELRHGAWLEVRNQNLDSTGDEGVSDAVRDEQMACRRRVFQLLACLYPANTILEAADRLNSDSEDEKAFAIEALDNLLRSQDKNLIVGIAEDLGAGFALASRSLNLDVALPKPVLEELLERRFGPASNLRVIMALENLATSGSARAVGLLEREIKSPELTIRETAARQLRHLAPERLEKFSVAPSLFYDHKSPAERVSILRKVRIFELIPGADLLKLNRVISERHLQSGERLFTKGEMGESLFIIVEGSARIHDGETELAKLGPGEVVGVLAALDPEPRNASVSATADTLVFSLHRERLYALLAEHQSLIERLIHMLCQRLRAALQTAVSVDEQEQIQELPGKSEDSAAPMATDAGTDLEDGLLPVEKVMLLRSAELFAELPEDALRQLAGVLVAEEYGSGDCIIEKDKFSTSLYVVFRGNTRVHDGDRTLATLGEKAVFGELAALDGEVRSASVSAIDRVSLFRLNRSDLIHVITENVEVTRGILQSLCRRLRELQAN